jgi:hypothetical protein
LVHVGSDAAFSLFRLPFQEHFAVSWLDVGRVTFANVVSARVTLDGLTASPILRMSTDDRRRGTNATVGLHFLF